MREYYTSFTVHAENGKEYEAYFTFEGVYEPAHTSGLPEDCHPGGSEVNVLKVEVTDKWGNSCIYDYDAWCFQEKLTEKDTETIESLCMEAMVEQVNEVYDDEYGEDY